MGIHMSDYSLTTTIFPYTKTVIREMHGLSAHPMHRTWKRMISRCYTPGASHFRLYGGRGIRVCARWHRFSNFFTDMLEAWRPGLSIDRIDPNGNYQPQNCRWATFRMQTHNRRRNLDVMFRGEICKLSEVAEHHSKVDYPTFVHRIKTGWEIESALITPPQKVCKRKPFILGGVHYTTLRGCSRLTGMSCQRIVNSIRRGEGRYL